MMEFSIREASVEDHPDLCELYAEVDALHLKAVPHVYRRLQKPARSKDFVSRRVASEQAALFVAVSQGSDTKIIGLVQVEIRETPDRPILVPGRFGWIADIVVRQACRSQGVGRALAERAHEWFHERDIREVRLAVWEFNDGARAFYEKLGYSTASRTLWTQLGLRR